MSDLEEFEGDVVSNDDYLEALASRIREEHRRSKDALSESIDAYIACGQCLLEAREALTTDQAFGAWFNAQQFGFSRQWAHTLRTAAANEVAVRAAVASQLATGKTANIEKAVKEASKRVALNDDIAGSHVARGLFNSIRRKHHRFDINVSAERGVEAGGGAQDARGKASPASASWSWPPPPLNKGGVMRWIRYRLQLRRIRKLAAPRHATWKGFQQ